jgi:hypothetical protein
MKRIVLTYGLIAGAFLSAMMFITMPFHDRIGYENAMVIGYTTMVLAFLMVFFGIRSYRDNVAAGDVSFGQGFKVGILITLIASLCYVLTWQLIYFRIAPEYADKIFAEVVEKERADGATEAELAVTRQKMTDFQEKYRNPLFNGAVTMMEVLPVGLLATLVSAAILRRRYRASSLSSE